MSENDPLVFSGDVNDLSILSAQSSAPSYNAPAGATSILGELPSAPEAANMASTFARELHESLAQSLESESHDPFFQEMQRTEPAAYERHAHAMRTADQTLQMLGGLFSEITSSGGVHQF